MSTSWRANTGGLRVGGATEDVEDTSDEDTSDEDTSRKDTEDMDVVEEVAART